LAQGLFNGSRGILTRISAYVLDLRLISGPVVNIAVKRHLFIQISITPSAEQIAFGIKQHQYPVCLAFSTVINEAQGQSIDNVGLDFYIEFLPTINSMWHFLSALQVKESKSFSRVTPWSSEILYI
jgi:hypothetical protein